MDREQAIKAWKVFSKDVGAFGRFFFKHLMGYESPKFHEEIYDELPKSNYLAVAAPRGHAKTTVGLIIYPIWHALFRKVGDVSLLSASEDFVIREISGKIKREFENNERLKLFFGEMKTSKWTESYFVLKNGIAFEGGGISGQLRGGRRGLIGLDDLENNETVESEEQRSKLKDRINKELIPKLLPEGQMIYFGTIIHSLAYLKQIIDIPDNGWKKLIYRAYPDEIQESGHELWQAMYPHALLQDRKAKMGSSSFSCEYMNNPVSDETSPIKENQIRYWKDMPTQYSSVIAVDPAYSEDMTADFKVAVHVGMDHATNRYLISYIRTHAPMGEYIDSILNMWMGNRGTITGIGIPNQGVEKSFFSSFMKRCDERKVNPPIVELKHSFSNVATNISARNKKSRIIAGLQPLFEQGKYYIHANHQEAREELLTIGSSRWDDLVDAMTYAEQILTPTYYEATPNVELVGANTNREGTDYGYGV
jgi:hypothetical protein